MEISIHQSMPLAISKFDLVFEVVCFVVEGKIRLFNQAAAVSSLAQFADHFPLSSSYTDADFFFFQSSSASVSSSQIVQAFLRVISTVVCTFSSPFERKADRSATASCHNSNKLGRVRDPPLSDDGGP